MPSLPSVRTVLVATAAFVLASLPALTADGAAADPGEPSASMWTPAPDDLPAARGRQRTVDPEDFRAYTLDDTALATALAGAPLRGTRVARRGGTVDLVVPAPTGELVHFAVVESPVLEPELQAAHPEIRTYAGNAVGFPDSIRLDVTPAGFHASVRRPDHRSWYVDPAYVGDDSRYLSYFGQDLPADQQPLVAPELDGATVAASAPTASRPGDNANLVTQRVYRLALLTDPSYAAYVAPGLNDGAHDTQSNQAVLAAKATLMNRVDQVYNDDLGITMQLINGSDALNLNTVAKAQTAGGACGSAPCFVASGSGSLTEGCTDALLSRQRHVIGLLAGAGAGAFDIGHLMLGTDGGGLASLGVVGTDAKAQGCTGVDTPVGDLMAIDYVAHEMGHQFDADHTFTSPSLCGSGNRNAATSVEPGGGSSVMAYAGICDADDLQPHSAPYFSQRSQTQIGSYVTSTASTPDEVQEVVLNGYDGAESFTLQYGGSSTAAVVRSTNYTLTGIKAAVQAVTGGTVSVAGLFGSGTLTTTGFQLTFSGALAGTDVANPVLQSGGGFTGRAAVITQGGLDTRAGSTITTTTNHNPVVTAPASATIPIRTPFTLAGSATDADGDPLTYLWEQNDRGGSTGIALTDNAKTNGPLFRVFGTYAAVSDADSRLYDSPGENLATSSPSRTFPDLAQVLAGSTNAATGSCPTTSGSGTLPNGSVLDCYSEFLPTAQYVGTGPNSDGSLNFRLTARDLRAGGGGSGFADVKLNVDRTVGPFQVTSQRAAGVTYAGGTTRTVTWTANTGALAADVRISLSTDGGQSFARVLAASTPNDGAASVVIPDVATSTARIRIEAVGNYFFDVNDAAFSIASSGSPLSISEPPAGDVAAQPGSGVGATFTAVTGTGPASVVSAAPAGLPAGLSIVGTDETGPGVVPSSVAYAVQGAVTAPPGRYPVSVQVSDGSTSQTVSFTVVVGSPPSTVGPDPAQPVLTPLAAAPADTAAPDTVITAGPASGSVLLKRSTTYGFAASEAASYRCAVDGRAVACGAGSAAVDLTSLAARSHVFTVAAVDAAGNVDPTPDRRTFVVPVDARALKDKGRAWTHRKAAQVDRPGASLTYRVSGATALSLVASTDKNAGAVKVLLNGRRLATVSLKGRSRSRRVLSLVTFATPVSGKVTIVTTTSRRVAVDGLAVSTVV